jgi:hypothetical protein
MGKFINMLDLFDAPIEDDSPVSHPVPGTQDKTCLGVPRSSLES